VHDRGARLQRVINDAEGSGAGPTTIVIADDHSVVRSGLRMLLDAEPDLEVVAEAGDVDAARRYVAFVYRVTPQTAFGFRKGDEFSQTR
jgi:hypothetical protein